MIKSLYRWDVKDLIKSGKEVMTVVKRDGEYKVIDAGEMLYREWLEDEDRLFFMEDNGGEADE